MQNFTTLTVNARSFENQIYVERLPCLNKFKHKFKYKFFLPDLRRLLFKVGTSPKIFSAGTYFFEPGRSSKRAVTNGSVSQECVTPVQSDLFVNQPQLLVTIFKRYFGLRLELGYGGAKDAVGSSWL